MKWSDALRVGLFLGSAALMLSSSASLADTTRRAQAAKAEDHGFDWRQHTQTTLAELKVKLNLAPAQAAAWQVWSDGVLKDADRNLDRRRATTEQHELEPQADLTTPEQMARGVERLRTHLAWMQERLAQLEAAQARTKAFYDGLDANQKTIFDLFWHDMYHRMAGHDGWGMHGHGGPGEGSMNEERQGPCCER